MIKHNTYLLLSPPRCSTAACGFRAVLRWPTTHGLHPMDADPAYRCFMLYKGALRLLAVVFARTRQCRCSTCDQQHAVHACCHRRRPHWLPRLAQLQLVTCTRQNLYRPVAMTWHNHRQLQAVYEPRPVFIQWSSATAVEQLGDLRGQSVASMAIIQPCNQPCISRLHHLVASGLFASAIMVVKGSC